LLVVSPTQYLWRACAAPCLLAVIPGVAWYLAGQSLATDTWAQLVGVGVLGLVPYGAAVLLTEPGLHPVRGYLRRLPSQLTPLARSSTP
jgi:hypothetical protein